MQKFSLELFFHIIGIGSASGLVLKDNSLFIISDNSGFLYEYHINEKEVTKIQLFESARENTSKKDKADFESITLKGNQLYLFGSGSTPKRNSMLQYNLITKVILHQDVTAIYNTMKVISGISSDSFNIEGALSYNDQWLLFQRGNGAQAKNGIFIVNDTEDPAPLFHPITLPKIQHIEAAFTDAIIVNGKIYFLAAVENTTSTYNDGQVLGTFYGVINPQTLEVEKTVLLSTTHKFEGICFYKEDTETLSFLLCEDNDTHILKSTIYTLTLTK